MAGPEYFAIRRNADGTERYYWRASNRLAKLLAGSPFRAIVRLSGTRAEAEELARDMTARVMHALAGVAEEDRPAAKQSINRSNDEHWFASGVYILGPIEGPVKIGRAKDPTARLNALQTGSAERRHLWAFVRLPRVAGIELERRMHEELRDRRVRGEWFNITAFEAMRELFHIAEGLYHLTRPASSPIKE